MTKVENKKREAEYLALLDQNRATNKRKRDDDDDDDNDNDNKPPKGKRRAVSLGRSLRYSRRALAAL